MTAPALAYPHCLCGDVKSEHRQGKRGCKVLDCGCDRFEERDEVEHERVLAVVAEVCGGEAEQARAELAARLGFNGESTSARLRRVEQERDEARAGHQAALAEMDERREERDAARAALNTVGEQRDLAHAELATARQVIEHLRGFAERRRVEADLQATEVTRLRQRLIGTEKRVEELQALLEHAEQYARDLQDNGDVSPAAEPIFGFDAWQCLTPGGCGARYTRRTAATNHPCGELTPVRVSITHRTEGAPPE